MSSPTAPPRIARRLLERALPRDVRQDISGDLLEMYRRRRAREGAARARVWYWQQVLSFSVRFLSERLREQRERTHMSTGMSWMDVKLAGRMLVRYPGLTLIAVVGMAIGMAIVAGAYGVLFTLVDPSLPLDEGDRIIAVQNWDPEKNRAERRVLHDLLTWREDLRSVTELGAFRQVNRNVIVPGAQPETVRVAEISAAGFRVARVAPLLGRPLLDADERPGAEPVVVIGFDVWRSRFAADAGVIGRPVQLGDTAHVIVGVMPEGFAFPVRHSLWTPLRLDPARYARRTGPELTVFGRLAPGASLDSANAELATVGRRLASEFPATHATLRPRVLPYTFPFFDIDDPSATWIVHLLQLLITLLLVIVCINVAILVYARTATRHAEIAVRTAIGASRGRIIGQLFAEALALSALAAVVGLALTSMGLRRVNAAMAEVFAGVPFWWHFDLSPGLVLYVVGLTLLSAGIVGVLPALRVTGPRVQNSLQRISAGGGAGMQLGRTWTLLIVVQVAIAVALLPAAVFHAWESVRYGMADPGFPAHEFLSTQLVLDRPLERTPAGASAPDPSAQLYAARHAELVRRLEAEPSVADVITASSIPGGEATVWIEAAGVPIPAGAAEQQGWVREGTRGGHEVRYNRVDVDYFAAFGVPLLTGRPLRAGDAGPGDNAIVVNESFVRHVFGGQQALGRRVRYVGASGDAAAGDVEFVRWYEIVGVVGDFPGKATESGLTAAKMYHASARAPDRSSIMLVRLRGTDPATFAGRLREISAAVDPNLQLRNIADVDSLLRKEQGMLRLIATVLAGLTASVILLSSAGIYALMSFTVSQRRKEIGIRAALGADPGRILRSIFSRAVAQLAAGAVLGAATAGLLEVATDGGLMKGHGVVVLPAVTLFMLAIGLLAALGPARRGMRVHPTDALRDQ